MSLITYNSVFLPYPTFTQFDQTAMYEPSNTDFYLSRFDIGVQCVINYNYLPLLMPSLIDGNGNPITTNPADIQNIIYQKLMTPRSSLSMKFNGVDVVPSSVGGGTPDAQNGPQPQSCKFLTMTNQSFILTWHCVAHYWINNLTGAASPLATNQAGSPVLYNRWTETQDIDERNFSTRNRSGRFMIRSDNVEGVSADFIRGNLAIVGVPDGFLRKSSQYIVDRSGLGIDYSVTDEEVFKKPPTPAFRASGKYTETTSVNGARRYGQVQLRLQGDKATPQSKLIETAIAVVSKKLAARGSELTNKKGGFNILQSAAMAVDMYDNEIELIAQVSIACTEATVATSISAFNSVSMTSTPVSDDKYLPPYQDRGTANMFLHAAAYWDPSLKGVPTLQRTSSPAGPNQMPAGKEPGTK